MNYLKQIRVRADYMEESINKELSFHVYQKAQAITNDLRNKFNL
jgi:hypothetical protein